jgi:hypothetical protein
MRRQASRRATGAMSRRERSSSMRCAGMLMRYWL